MREASFGFVLDMASTNQPPLPPVSLVCRTFLEINEPAPVTCVSPTRRGSAPSAFYRHPLSFRLLSSMLFAIIYATLPSATCIVHAQPV